MSFIPTLKLYASDGNTLVYTFSGHQATNMPQDPKKKVIHSALRGNNAIVITGGNQEWELYIDGIFLGADYEEIAGKISAIETAIVLGTPYVLKFQKTATTYYSYNVKRVTPIDFPDSLRNTYQEYKIIFLANSW